MAQTLGFVIYRPLWGMAGWVLPLRIVGEARKHLSAPFGVGWRSRTEGK